MNRYAVSVNGCDLEVTLLRRSGSQIAFEANGKSYEVDVRPLLSLAPAAGIPATVPVNGPAAAPARGKSAGSVTAPMPGIIVKVNVGEGQPIQPGETVVVIEAMKMENNIPAAKAGTVKKLHVKKGDEVQNAQLLVTIE